MAHEVKKSSDAHATYKVLRRNRTITPFNREKINTALTKAFLAVEGQEASGSQRLHDIVRGLTETVVQSLIGRNEPGVVFPIEDIQDKVELALMRGGYQKVARAYVLYREARARERATVELRDVPIRREVTRAKDAITEASEGLAGVQASKVIAEFEKNIYDGASDREISDATTMAARVFVELDPNYGRLAARLLLDRLRTEVFTKLDGSSGHDGPLKVSQAAAQDWYQRCFRSYLDYGIAVGRLAPELVDGRFDLARLEQSLHASRDFMFQLLGFQTLYDRYFLHHDGVRFEMPQYFFMRVAMGLALREDDPTERAIEFYELLSSHRFMSSTPTLFNSGTPYPQLSSCFLTTIGDDLDNIFKSIKDNALLAKFSGGIGNDWTPVRGLGAHIKGTNGESQGTIPFMKVANDTAVAVNQGGKRKGAVVGYLETWHLDIEAFLDLRKNTGDDRRRTHDMNTANWIPDLFMQRVQANGAWTLFSPDDVPHLHELYGLDFKAAYEQAERDAEAGKLRNYRTVQAVDLWRRMLTMLFETGHPWLTFKDPCNLRSPQRHVGVVHSSNLCTEITLNTNRTEVAVCNLGSVNLALHMVEADGEMKLDQTNLRKTIRTAMRMLDNVIDINLYTIPEARESNLRHRPVALGLMGFQDALYQMRLPYGDQRAADFAGLSMEAISYYAIEASCDLALERGSYETFAGSQWSQGKLPVYTYRDLMVYRERFTDNVDWNFDWAALAAKVVRDGMRNSNTMAIAPTATISNICGVTQSIEPTYENLFVKSNMSGDFTVLNEYLVRDLKARNLWDDVMVSDLKYYDGSLGQIDRVPDDLKALYATAFEVPPKSLIDAAALRQIWIDQAQSLNLYVSTPSGRLLDEVYTYAWQQGLKTTYYLRSRGASHVEKSTSRRDGRLTGVSLVPPSEPEVQACSIDNPECESCQ